MRHLLALAGVLLAGPAAVGQDMALSQIVKEGEDWRLLAPPVVPATFAAGGSVRTPYFVKDRRGSTYYTLPGEAAVFVRAGAKTRKLPVPLAEPTGLALWADEGTLVVADAADKYLWAFRIDADGSLSAAEPYYPLWVKPGRKRSGADFLTLDAAGRLYAATDAGVQVFDPTGRLCGVLRSPAEGKRTRLAFTADGLTFAVGVSGYVRKMQAKGIGGP